MKSKLLGLVLLTLLIGVAGQAFGLATVTSLPSQVPKGAYVNGPGGASDDNYYWQAVKIIFGGAHDFGGGSEITITLPTGMYVADTDGDGVGGEDDDVSLSWVVSGTTTFAVNAATAAGSIVLNINTAVTANNDYVWVMFPVITDTNPSVTSAGYAITFTDTTPDASIPAASGPQVTYRDAGALDIAPFATNMAGDNDSTSTYGQMYPASPAAMWTALPDFVKDAGVKAFETSTTTLLSDNLATNGTFTGNAIGWSATGSGAYNANNAYAANAAAGTIQQNIGAIAGHTYTLTYTVTITGGNSVQPSIGGTNGTLRNTVGTNTYTETIGPVASTANLIFTGSADGGESVVIDNVVVGDDADDITYTLWAATDSTLSHISILTSGVTRAVNFETSANYTVNEGATGSAARIATAAIPEGNYYFFITSSLTGDFPLARSGQLHIRHYPEVKILGWDYNDDTVYDNEGAGYDDDNSVTLDTGLYYGYTGALGTTARKDLDVYINTEDYDDNARVYLFYSTNNSLTSTSIATSGTSPNIVVTGLTGATVLADTLYENTKDTNGFLMWNWNVSPVGTTYITASSYTLYIVANDGKHQSILASKGSDSADQETVAILHSPNLVLDTLLEYDPDADVPVAIETGNYDTIMLSWGKQGVDKDFDIDDSALISFYIVYDASQNGTSDYTSAQASTLTGAVDDLTTGIHRIVTGIQENPDTQSTQYYAWNLKADFASTGWYPTAGVQYLLYAIIDENKTGGTLRVVALGDDGKLDLEAITVIKFTNKPFARLSAPPAEGVTINAEETYRLPFSAFDWPVNGQIGVYVVKNDATGFASGPDTSSVTTLRGLAAAKAYCLTDANGDPADGGLAYLAENTATYYDMTLRIPGSSSAKYSKSMEHTATDLTSGTYWVYIGTDHIYNGEFTGAATNWTVDGVRWTYGGDAVSKIAGGAGQLEQTVSIVQGQAYTLTYTLGATAGGNIKPVLGATDGQTKAAGGTYTETIIAGAGSKLEFVADAATTVASLDNVSLVSQLYRAPGPLTVVNADVASIQRNLTVSPMEATVAQGDTLTFTVKGADNGATIDRIDAYISVDKTWWTLVNSTTPFTAAAAYAGKLIANAVIDDTANNRWILRTVVFNAGAQIDLSAAGLGDDIATFQLLSKGTTDAIQHLTNVAYVNDPGNGWVTKFSNNGVDQSINFLSSTVKVVPRAIVEGIVELQGRVLMNAKFTFELRKRGGYAPITDAVFSSTNDADLVLTGLQIVPDTDGKFTLWKIPTGEYDLVAKYDRYLSKKVAVNMYPGIDTLFVSFGTLLGGDCWGYSDSLKYVYPDNQVDVGDLNRVATAFLATSSNAKWNDGLNNWKWADINEDGIVETDDLSLTTANFDQSGAQPVYKPATLPVASNIGTVVEFMNVPSELKAGETYTIQVVARNAAAVRAYFVNMRYDAATLDFTGIRKGNFINVDSYSFPVVGDGTVGLANSVFGDVLTSGDGVLAEMSFTARTNGMFDASMLTFDKISFVNGEFLKENLESGPGTGINSNNPISFALGQNYPNPFNPNTVIGFDIPESGSVSLMVYDILGRNVRTLVSQSYQAGRHSVVWDGRDDSGNVVSAGVYIYTIKSGNFSAAKKMLFMK